MWIVNKLYNKRFRSINSLIVLNWTGCALELNDNDTEEYGIVFIVESNGTITVTWKGNTTTGTVSRSEAPKQVSDFMYRHTSLPDFNVLGIYTKIEQESGENRNWIWKS